MEDWLAVAPEYGVGLLLTQVQESPPSEPGTAPVGKESFTQTVLLVIDTILVLPELVFEPLEPPEPPEPPELPEPLDPAVVTNVPWLGLLKLPLAEVSSLTARTM